MKCAYKKAQQQIKEEAFQDGDFLQKVHQNLSSPDVLENSYVSKNVKLQQADFLINISDILKTLLHKC